MDDKGFIFTADATLALVVVIVITASIVTYLGLPVFQGEDNQHLEALADSVLESMDQNGTLARDTALYSSNNTTLQQEGRDDLIENLNLVIPQGIGYRLTVGSNPPITSTDSDASVNHTSPATSTDVATKVKVISGGQIGWVGRAYYKQEEVHFVDENDTQVTTVWDFHNWLTNFKPWNTYKLQTDNYWGGSNKGTGQTYVDIPFIVPSNGTINGAKLLIGSSSTDTSNNGKPFGADFVLNDLYHHYLLSNSSFNYVYTANNRMFNSYSTIDPHQLLSGLNKFYIQFNATSYNDMPWYSLIANYTTTISVPQGVQTDPFYFPDIAGVGRDTGSTSYLFDLNSGTTTSTTSRTYTWSNLQTAASNTYDFSTPFRITGMTGLNPSQGSAVGTETNVYLPPGERLFDAYVVVNAYGGTDGVIVQVEDSSGTWHTAFDSFDPQYSARSATDGGYGNIPGIIDIHNYITAGNNKVRIISYDEAQGGDYDLTGLVNCYAKITYSALPIRWDTFPFASYQNTSSSDTKSYTGKEAFNIANDAQEALLFVSGGISTRNITVTCYNSTTSSVLYNGTVPYVLNLGDLDAANSKHIITKPDGNGNYTLIPGSYTLTVKVIPSKGWESGDNGFETVSSYTTDADPALYSGTRISIIYPKFLQNEWSNGFATTAQAAKDDANQTLQNFLSNNHITFNASLIKTEAIYTGDMPNAIPVRLELWKQ